MRNLGTCRFDVKGEFQVGGPHEGESTDARHRGGAIRSRDEGAVMALDRRSCIVWLYWRVNQRWDEPSV